MALQIPDSFHEIKAYKVMELFEQRAPELNARYFYLIVPRSKHVTDILKIAQCAWSDTGAVVLSLANGTTELVEAQHPLYWIEKDTQEAANGAPSVL